MLNTSTELIVRRIAELWQKQQKHELSKAEDEEWCICLNALSNYYWKLAQLENMSLLASMTDDANWQHKICAKIDQLTQ